MSLTTTPPTRTRRQLALAALFLGTFVMGSAELVVVGILDTIAADLRVPVGTAGTVVTGYALGLCLGGPALALACARMRRHHTLWLSLSAYVLVSLLAALAPTFAILVVARVATGAFQGMFLGAALALAGSMVTPDRIGWATSVVFGGVAVSTAIGVPLGTFVGQGFNWRAAFLLIVALGFVALAAVLVLVPRDRARPEAADLSTQRRQAFAPRVLTMLGVGFLLMGGQFVALTYITPFMIDVTGISTGWISLFLLVYGCATAVGAFTGGRAADWSASATLLWANVALVAAIGLFWVGGSEPVLVLVALAIWGLVGFGFVPSLLQRVMVLAGSGRDLAATLPAPAVNAGIAIGSILGGQALAGYGTPAPAMLAVAVCAFSLPLTFLSRRLRTPEGRHEA